GPRPARGGLGQRVERRRIEALRQVSDRVAADASLPAIREQQPIRDAQGLAASPKAPIRLGDRPSDRSQRQRYGDDVHRAACEEGRPGIDFLRQRVQVGALATHQMRADDLIEPLERNLSAQQIDRVARSLGPPVGELLPMDRRWESQLQQQGPQLLRQARGRGGIEDGRGGGMDAPVTLEELCDEDGDGAEVPAIDLEGYSLVEGPLASQPALLEEESHGFRWLRE